MTVVDIVSLIVGAFIGVVIGLLFVILIAKIRNIPLNRNFLISLFTISFAAAIILGFIKTLLLEYGFSRSTISLIYLAIGILVLLPMIAFYKKNKF